MFFSATWFASFASVFVGPSPTHVGSARVLALIDGNSFYCSCERVFDAKLATRPVIVLSKNDECAVARTPEAKALGIRMGEPFFKIRDLCRDEGVAVFSSNYTLYGDMSARMNAIYRQWAPDVEVYSIDESFLDLTGFGRRDLDAFARDLRSTVRQWTGIRVVRWTHFLVAFGPAIGLVGHMALTDTLMPS